MQIYSWVSLNRRFISLRSWETQPLATFYRWHFSPLTSWSQLPHPVPWTHQLLLSCPINLSYLLLQTYFWMSMCTWVRVPSTSLSMSSPPTSISLAATPHPLNAPSPSFWPSGGGASAVTRMTHTRTPQISCNPSSPEVVPHPSLPNKFPMPTFLMPCHQSLQPTHYPQL